MRERRGTRNAAETGPGRAWLLGSGALAGAGAALAGGHPAAAQVKGIELGLGGFANEFLFVTGIDEDDADARDFNEVATHFDGEVQFTGKAELDNGLTFGFQAELEVPTVGDQIDEVFVTVEGAFGKLVLGGDNSASYTMGLGLWDPYVGVPINSGWVSDFAPPPPGMTIAFRSPAAAAPSTSPTTTTRSSIFPRASPDSSSASATRRMPASAATRRTAPSTPPVSPTATAGRWPPTTSRISAAWTSA